MHARLALAPEAPAFLGFEAGEGLREMVGRIPMVEFFARRLVDDGTDDEIGLGHRIGYGDDVYPRCASARLRALVGYGYRNIVPSA